MLKQLSAKLSQIWKTNKTTDSAFIVIPRRPVEVVIKDTKGRERVLKNLDDVEFEDSPKNPYGKYITSSEHRGRQFKVTINMFEKGDVVAIFHKDRGQTYSEFFPFKEQEDGEKED